MKANILFVGKSMYHGNTEKIGMAMAKKVAATYITSAQAIKMCEEELESVDMIGIGSGIYFAQLHHEIEALARRLRAHQKVILYSTHGAPFLGKYHDTVKQILKEKHIMVIGEFSCKGYDCTGPYNLYGGGNKGKPNEKDEARAASYMAKILPEYAIDTNRTTNGMHVQICDTCIGCGACVKACPMQILQKEKGTEKSIVDTSMQEQESHAAIKVIDDDACIHCGMCQKVCPTQAIRTQHTKRELLKIIKKLELKRGLL